MVTEKAIVRLGGGEKILFLSSFWIYFYGNEALRLVWLSSTHDKWHFWLTYKALLCIKKSLFLPERIWPEFAFVMLVKLSLLIVLSFFVKKKFTDNITYLFQELCYLIYIVDFLYLFVYPVFVVFGINIDWYYASTMVFFSLSVLTGIIPWSIFCTFSLACIFVHNYFTPLSAQALLTRLLLAFISFLSYIAVIETYTVWKTIRF